MDQVMDKFLSDPDIHDALVNKAHRTVDDKASFYGSSAFKLLDKDCAYALTKEGVKTMLISIGGDGVQLLNWGNRTATVIAVKLEDLPPHLVQTGQAVAPLVVIEGPQEPSVLNAVLRSAVTFLCDHAPSTDRQSTQLAFHPRCWCIVHHTDIEYCIPLPALDNSCMS